MTVAELIVKVYGDDFMLLTKNLFIFCTALLLIAFSNNSWSNDRLAITYASFDSNGFNNFKSVVAFYKALGFKRISLVPTYYHEHLNEIIDKQTPSINTIKACLTYLIENEFKIVYKPHIDPVKYMSNYDIFSSDNASWRVNVGWRGFFDIDPLGSKQSYYDVVILPILKCLQEIYEQKKHTDQLAPVRLELGAELMNSMIRHGDNWHKVAQKTRNFIDSNKLGNFVKLSHNFTHHLEIEEDYLLRMNKAEKKWLRKYIESLDEVAVSQYMDLTIFASGKQASNNNPINSIAEAILFHQQRFRKLILGEHLKVKSFATIPVHIGEFGIGAGGLKHPNYWEGRKIDKAEQAIGFAGLLEFLKICTDLPNEKNLNATIWTVGPAYDIFGFSHPEGLNEPVVNQIRQFLRE